MTRPRRTMPRWVLPLLVGVVGFAIVHPFEVETRAAFTRLAGWLSGDLRREAHAIKGGAANLAASELSSAAAELENTARSGSLGEALGGVARLETAYRRLETKRKKSSVSPVCKRCCVRTAKTAPKRSARR